jgi:Tol biopolymer transport system component
MSRSGVSVVSASYVADGSIRLVADESGDGVIYRVGANGGAATRLFALPDDVLLIGEPAIPSPDGAHYAFIRDRRPGGFELYAVGEDGIAPRRMTTAFEPDAPVWSPDGSRLAFAAHDVDRVSRLWLVNFDGSDLTRVQLPDPLGSGDSFAWSPDGDHLAIELDQEVEGDLTSSIFIVRVDGSGLQRITASRGDEEDPAWTAP